MTDGENPNGVLPTSAASLPAPLLSKLADYAAAARGAFADATIRALRADTKILAAWCEGQGVSYLPMAAADLVRFIDAKGQDRAPATVTRYVSSVARLHRAADFPSPAQQEIVRLALRRMWRTYGRAQKQADALNRRLVDRMLDVCSKTPRGLRNAALLATAYDTMARRSELVAMTVEDMAIDADGHGSMLIQRSKTDQEGQGSSRYLGPDTVRALRAWLDQAGIEKGAVFQGVYKNGRSNGEALNARKIPIIYKEIAQKAGLTAVEAARISGHSARIGSAQDQSASGFISITSIMESGGWKTPRMVAHYTRRQAIRGSGSARLAEFQRRL
jgi:integrase